MEKITKPKRKETITETLRAGIQNLERFRHPKILQVSKIRIKNNIVHKKIQCILLWYAVLKRYNY